MVYCVDYTFVSGFIPYILFLHGRNYCYFYTDQSAYNILFNLLFLYSDPLPRCLYITYKAKKNFIMDKTSCYNIIQQCNRASQLLQDNLVAVESSSLSSSLGLNKVMYIATFMEVCEV